MGNEEIKMVTAGKFLYETGLLFEINRRVLHPFGLALQVDVDDQEGALSEEEAIITLSNMLWDYRDDSEGLLYGEEALERGFGKFQRFLEEFGREKLEQRLSLLGFTIQTKEKNISKVSKSPEVVDASKIVNKEEEESKQPQSEEISDEEIEQLKKKIASKRTTQSITDKLKVITQNKDLTPVDPSQTESESAEFRRIKKFMGKEHNKLGKSSKCVSTKENTVYSPISGGSGIVSCTSCGAILRDPDIGKD